MSKSERAFGPRTGFTLVELLIAIAILSFLVVVLSSLVSGVSRAWTAGNRQAETFQNGRAILDLISRDVSQAVIAPSLQFIQNPGHLDTLLTGGAKQVVNTDAVFLQTTLSADPLGGVAETGYYLAHRVDAAGNEHFELKRFFVPPTDPRQPPATAQPNPAFQIYDSPSPVLYNTSGNSTLPPWLNLTTTSFNAPQTDFEYFSSTVSDGVVGFWIRCLDVNGDAISWLSSADPNTDPIRFNSTAYFQNSIPGQANTFNYTDSTSTLQANLLPAKVEITIITVDSQTFARRPTIPGIPASSAPDQIPDAIRTMNQSLIAQKISAARTFSTTVTLHNAHP